MTTVTIGGLPVQAVNLNASDLLHVVVGGVDKQIPSSLLSSSISDLLGLGVDLDSINDSLNQGIPEWEVGNEYFIGYIAREVGGTKLYKSITDGNIGNVLTDVVNWELLVDLAASGVEAASQAEVDTGTVADKYVAPSTLLGLFNASLQGSNGYARLPVNIGGAFDEIIIQWGNNGAAGSGILNNQILPLAYPNAHLIGYGVLGNETVFPTSGEAVIANPLNLTTLQVGHDFNGIKNISWLSIGY